MDSFFKRLKYNTCQLGVAFEVLVGLCPHEVVPGHGFGGHQSKWINAVDMGLLSPDNWSGNDELHRDKCCK
jgi:hypothetical protein